MYLQYLTNISESLKVQTHEQILNNMNYMSNWNVFSYNIENQQMKKYQHKNVYTDSTFSSLVETNSNQQANTYSQQKNQHLEKMIKNKANCRSKGDHRNNLIQGVSLIESRNYDYIFIKDFQSNCSQTSRIKEEKLSKPIKTQPDQRIVHQSVNSNSKCLNRSYQYAIENGYFKNPHQQNQKLYNKKIFNKKILRNKQVQSSKHQKNHNLIRSFSIENINEELKKNFNQLLKNSCINHYGKQAKFSKLNGKKYCSKCAIKIVQAGQYLEEFNKVVYSQQISEVLRQVQNINSCFFEQLNESQSIYAYLLKRIHQKKKMIQTTFQNLIEQLNILKSADLENLNNLQVRIKAELKKEITNLSGQASRLQGINEQIQHLISEQNKKQESDLKKVIINEKIEKIKQNINEIKKDKNKQRISCWQKHIQAQYQTKYRIEQTLENVKNIKTANQNHNPQKPILQLDRRRLNTDRRIKQHQKYLTAEENRSPFRDLFPETPYREKDQEISIIFSL